MKTITIDRSRPLREQPKTGHNRWHPDIPPAIEVDEGEEVALETRDATDGYLNPKSTVADFPGLPAGGIHPLTGPVLVKGASPTPALGIAAQRSGFSHCVTDDDLSAVLAEQICPDR